MRRFTLVLAAALAMAGPAATSRAAAVSFPGQVAVVAGYYVPGADLYKGDTFVAHTNTLVLPQGSTLTFRNLESGKTHNITSGVYGVPGPADGLFGSNDVNYLAVGDVAGVSALPPGNYPFYCTYHYTTLTGVLIIE